jgi:hypothetical protein
MALCSAFVWELSTFILHLTRICSPVLDVLSIARWARLLGTTGRSVGNSKAIPLVWSIIKLRRDRVYLTRGIVSPLFTGTPGVDGHLGSRLLPVDGRGRR